MIEFDEIYEQLSPSMAKKFKILPYIHKKRIAFLSNYIITCSSLYLQNDPSEQKEMEIYIKNLAQSFIEECEPEYLEFLYSLWQRIFNNQTLQSIENKQKVIAGLRRGYDFMVVASMSRY